MRPKTLILIILLALVGLFLVQNTVVVEVRFLFWHLAMSRSMLVILLVAVGALIGWLGSGWIRRHWR